MVPKNRKRSIGNAGSEKVRARRHIFNPIQPRRGRLRRRRAVAYCGLRLGWLGGRRYTTEAEVTAFCMDDTAIALGLPRGPPRQAAVAAEPPAASAVAAAAAGARSPCLECAAASRLHHAAAALASSQATAWTTQHARSTSCSSQTSGRGKRRQRRRWRRRRRVTVLDS